MLDETEGVGTIARSAAALLLMLALPRRSAVHRATLDVIEEIQRSIDRDTTTGNQVLARVDDWDRAVTESFVTGGVMLGVFESITARSEVVGRRAAENCSCGASAFEVLREPNVSAGHSSHQVVCLRCGDTESGTEYSPRLVVSGPRDVRAGQSVVVHLEWTPQVSGIFWLGLNLRSGFDATVELPVLRVSAHRGQILKQDWAVAVSASAGQEAQYVRPFVVGAGNMSAARHHLRVWV